MKLLAGLILNPFQNWMITMSNKMFFGNLRCMKEASNWDMGIPEIVETDCIGEIEKVSGIDFKTFMYIMHIVIYEGHFGPDGISDDEENGEFTFSKAKDTVLKTYRDVSFGDFGYLNPEFDYVEKCESCKAVSEALLDEDEHCEECGSEDVFPVNNSVVQGSDIKREFFSGIREIYG